MSSALVFICTVAILTPIAFFYGRFRARNTTYLLEDAGVSVLLSGNQVVHIKYNDIKWIKVKYSGASGPLVEIWTNNFFKSSDRVSIYYGITELVVTPDNPAALVDSVKKRMYYAKE